MVKSVRSSVDGYPLIRVSNKVWFGPLDHTPSPHPQEAMGKMMEVAEHVNAMKRKYDTAVHVQEIQSLIRGQEVSAMEAYCCFDCLFTLFLSLDAKT